ncbi:regulator [Streptomyces sp. AcH 505]|uniref:ATP-binding protein n=1 Tax=Streptomyces sp. AcH 505 TaxID=352211 RepID=UPI0005919FB5|nr:regulator [Streptomyces sp. AcH 505]
MVECRFNIARKAWGLSFLAESVEVAGLRRLMRMHLNLWGLPTLVDAAQSCVTELVGNVITHVGPGTPTALVVSMNGTHLRIEVSDPDTRTLPTLVAATDEAESGRGVALVDALTDRWGVILRGNSKVTWCELETGLRSGTDHIEGPQVAKAEALLSLYCWGDVHAPTRHGRLNVAMAEEAAIDLIADLLHWLRAHGCDPDGALDRAQTHFEAEASESQSP